MREQTLRAGVSTKRFEKFEANIEMANPEFRARILEFLVNTYDNEFQGVLKVWNMPHMTPEMWDNYKHLGVKDLDEQVMLKEAQDALKEKWKHLPPKHVEKQNAG